MANEAYGSTIKLCKGAKGLKVASSYLRMQHVPSVDALNVPPTSQDVAWRGLYLSEVTSSTTMDGSVTAWGGSCRVPCPAEEGCEGALAAPKEAPTLLWRCPV